MISYTSLFEWLPNFLLLLILPLLSLVLLKQKNKSKRPNLPPGPSGLSVIGNLHQLGHLPHRSLWQLSKKHGPLMYLKLGQAPTVVISSPKMAREIMKTHDLECCSRPPLVSYVKYSYNLEDIAFRHYDEYWREMRKILISELLTIKRVETFRLVREEEAARLIASISSYCSHSKDPFNVSSAVHTFMNNVICRVLFGRSYEGETEGEKSRLHDMFDEARSMLGGFFVADYLPWMWILDVISGIQGRLNRNFLDMNALYERVIEEHLDPKRQKQGREDFVDTLLQFHKESNLSMQSIKAVIMNVLIGGTDTSSAVVQWGMTELIRNPRVMKKVQEEVRRVIGNKGKVEESDLHQLTYLKSVVKETFRLHPSGVLLVPRETLQHFKIEDYDIPPKTRVIINAWAIGRDPNTWEDPEEFIPERFDDISIDYRGLDFELIPFGAGRRGCPGANFSTMTVHLSLANLLYSFEWELPAGMNIEDVDITEKQGISIVTEHPLKLLPIKYNHI